jgi:TonB-linked SusC/RagA family outer membrane protein
MKRVARVDLPAPGQRSRAVATRRERETRPIGIGFCLLILLLAGVAEARAQNHQVSGTVTSAEMQPIAGVSVVVEGTTIGTITNANGNYTLLAPSAAGTLVFSSLGRSPRSVPIEGRSVINVTLETQAIALDELVVVGYGAQQRVTVSGSVSSVSASDLENTAATTTANALVGRIQGINTRMTTAGFGRNAATGDPTDGRPGGASVIQIRNMGAPLFVIDGVPTDNPNDFNHINPADIDNISILKDAAAAVYGFRAANGVVLVTTKRGSRIEAPRVRIDGYYGWQNFSRYHYKDLANAYDYVFSELDSQNNRGQPRSYTPEILNLWRTGAPGYESTNHYPLVVNNPNAAQYNVNASVSGGASNVQYYLSLGHVNQDYVMRENNWNRTNVQANLSSELAQGLRIGTEISGRLEVHDNIAVAGDQDVVRSMLLGVHTSWPTQNPWVDRDTRTMIDYNVRRLDRTVAMYTKELSGWREDVRRRGTGNFWAEYALPFGTTVRGTYSHQFGLRSYDLQQYDFTAWDCADRSNHATCVERPALSPRLREHTKREDRVSFAQVRANHSERFGAHSLAAVAAWELSGTEEWLTTLNAIPPNNLSHLIGITDVVGMNNAWGTTRRMSFAGRVNYDFDQKYLLEFLGRYDGSYLYAPERRWGFFPGVTAGWRITQEPFLYDRFSWLNELKLRASWGQTGREQGINPWGYLGGGTYGASSGAAGAANTLPGGSVFDTGLVPSLRPRGLPVTGLSWVTSTMQNVGFDYIVFNNRLAGEVDFFERKLTGLPASRYDVLLPIEVGYSLPNENLEAMSTRGFEGIIRYNSGFRGVNYSLAPNFTVSRTKITERYKPRFGNSWDRYRNGDVSRWEGVNFGYRVLGQFQTVEEIENYKIDVDNQGNRQLLPGDLIYEDTNGDGIINVMDMRPIGFPTNEPPVLSFGLTSSASYRGISLAADFAGGALYSHNRGAETKNMFQGGHNAQKYFMDRWHRVDPFNPQSEWQPGKYPPFRQGGTWSSFNKNDDFWRTNVRFVRLRRIELGYSVPDNLAGHVGLSGLRVYSSATNPYSWDNTAHYGIDPETVQGTALTYPTISVVNIGFSANIGGGIRSPAPVVPVPAGDSN